MMAQPTNSGVQNAPPSSPSGWNELVDALSALPYRLLEKLPVDMRLDAQIQQEVGMLVLESLAVSAIETIGSDGDNPCFLPNQNVVLSFPMPNADTTYRVAWVSSGGVYRLRGQLGSLRLLHLSQIGPERSLIDLNTLRRSPDGSFDLLLSEQRPAQHMGDWWRLTPGANRLLLRMVSSDWRTEQDPAISIERIDCPPHRSRPSAAELEQRLRLLSRSVAQLPLMFVDCASKLRDEGFINKFKAIDLSQSGGVAGQVYFDAAYELRDDEALYMEAKTPASSSYFSLILGDDIYQTIDWYNNHSSLNDAQCRVDEDGMLRVIISAKDPGTPNWLDTAGYARGLFQARWICGEAMETPSLRKISFNDIRRVLPSDTPNVTPDERSTIIRQRRHLLQQRPLW